MMKRAQEAREESLNEKICTLLDMQSYIYCSRDDHVAGRSLRISRYQSEQTPGAFMVETTHR